MLIASTTLLAPNGRHRLVNVAWEETEAIDNGSLIRACAQIVKVKEGSRISRSAMSSASNWNLGCLSSAEDGGGMQFFITRPARH